MDKEEEINRRIEMLRRKNEELMRRHKEVEADKKSAEKSGQSFISKPSLPDSSSENAGRSDREGGGHQTHTRAHMDNAEEKFQDRDNHRTWHNNTSRGTVTSSPGSRRGTPSRGHGRGGRRSQEYDEKRHENFRPMEEEMEQSPGEVHTSQGRISSNRGSGRGTPSRGHARGGRRFQEYDEKRHENFRRMEADLVQSPGEVHTSRGRVTSNPGSGRGTPTRGHGRGGKTIPEYDEKRLENFRLMEEEMAQSPGENQDPPVSRFLDDPRRRGDLEPEDRWKSTRHKGSYGGLEFDNVKRGIRGGRMGRVRGNRGSRGRGRGMSSLQMSAELTGRERQDQERWHVMREAADKEIMLRSKNAQGKWRREWDSEKGEEHVTQRHQESGRTDQYDESRRPYRGGGRGKRGYARGRRGSKSSHDSTDNGKEIHKEAEASEESPKPDAEIGREPAGSKDQVENEETSTAESPKESKPQMLRKKQNKSPRHLVQQRAQTPSSKDGTEVWAQNSHHSDETGADWKNGASRSMEQWLPSNEGNRNPAIDERMLEQQEDGATVYSQHLGRGWGSEKNIKATKAWVIDTEKAGAAEQKPVSEDKELDNTIGRNDDRNFGKMHTGRNFKTGVEDCRIKEVISERAEMRSASPRLKRGNPGLTVEILKGVDRRVKCYSEGDSVQSLGSKDGKKCDLVLPEKADKEPSPPNKSPLSAEFLKTPEGLKHVEDWATEMDLQSPTYEIRHKELQKDMEQEAKIENGKLKGPELSENTDPKTGDRTVAENLPSGVVKIDNNAVDNQILGVAKNTDPKKDENIGDLTGEIVKTDDSGDDRIQAPSSELSITEHCKEEVSEKTDSGTDKDQAHNLTGEIVKTDHSGDDRILAPSSELSITEHCKEEVSERTDSGTDKDQSRTLTGEIVKTDHSGDDRMLAPSSELSIIGHSKEEVSEKTDSGTGKDDNFVEENDEMNGTVKDASEGTFKDAAEEIEDEFYECEANAGQGQLSVPEADLSDKPHSDEPADLDALGNPAELSQKGIESEAPAASPETENTLPGVATEEKTQYELSAPVAETPPMSSAADQSAAAPETEHIPSKVATEGKTQRELDAPVADTPPTLIAAEDQTVSAPENGGIATT